MSGVELRQLISEGNGQIRFEQPDGSSLVFSWRINTKTRRAFAMWWWERGDGKPVEFSMAMLKIDRQAAAPVVA
jgi:hypothetical protein